MTEPNYKDFADKFYNLLKDYSHHWNLPVFQQLVKDYEELHKPKMTRCAVMRECLTELVDYNNQTYALFWGNWYILESGKLYQVSKRYGLFEELNQAYEEYKKSKR